MRGGWHGPKWPPGSASAKESYKPLTPLKIKLNKRPLQDHTATNPQQPTVLRIPSSLAHKSQRGQRGTKTKTCSPSCGSADGKHAAMIGWEIYSPPMSMQLRPLEESIDVLQQVEGRLLFKSPTRKQRIYWIKASYINRSVQKQVVTSLI